MASLYENLESIVGLLVVGFADDTNLLSFARDGQANQRRLERAWQVCEEWAISRGMQFAPEKSELIHFTRSTPDQIKTTPRRYGNQTARVRTLPRCMAG